MTEPLSDIAIQRELNTLPGWSRRGDTLQKIFPFRTFPDAIAFVGWIATLAEARDHHPDMDIRYTKVTCTLSTHDAGSKVSAKDVALARAIEGAVS